MKKKNKVFASILSAMILGSCLATPAFAAETDFLSDSNLRTSSSNTSCEVSETTEESIVSQTTKQLPLTEPNMVQHQEITTIYEDDFEIVLTVKAYSDSMTSYAASSWKNITGTATAQAKSGGKPVALITVNGTFRYDSANKLVERTKYSKNIQIQDSKYKVDRFDYSLDTGTYLGGKTWAYVRANFKVGAYLTNRAGYAELKCDSDGNITASEHHFQV